MALRRVLPVLAFCLPLAFAACSSETSNEGEPSGTGGVGGSGGSVGASGKSGAAGKGVAGQGGSGGASGQAGKGGGTAGDAGSSGAAAGTSGSAGAAGDGSAAGAAGSGSVVNCPAGRADCNGDPTDGCEQDTTNSSENCGACGHGCEAGPNQTATCTDSVCGTVCHLGFDDCDATAPGCETDTGNDPAHCGSCAAEPCPSGANGTAMCASGACGFACAPSFGDCDGDLTTGCEAPLADNTEHCGSCNNTCDAGTKCVGGACECAATSAAAELLPIDLFVILDQSSSMNDPASNGKTRWVAIRDALENFVTSATAGVGVGIQYFPQTTSPGTPEACTNDAQCGAKGPCAFRSACTKVSGNGYPFCENDSTCADNAGGSCKPVGRCSESGASCFPAVGLGCSGGQQCVPVGICDQKYCDTNTYATPDVAITPLPAGAASITQSLSSHTPNGGTPTGPALAGATQYASAWAKTHPDHVVAVVMATDGLPSMCSPQGITEIAAIAANAKKADPKVLTFVIGVFDQANATVAQKNLDTIAAAGGGQPKATIITTGDVTAQFQAALDDVRKSVVGCDYQIPQPTTGTLDYSLVNVILTSSMGGPETLKGVNDLASCGADGGWSYDNPAAPTKISLCPASCTKAQASVGNKVDISLGCATRKD
jgi:hypothetical protein